MACGADRSPELSRPNIVLIYIDDLDFKELAVTGGPVLTPNMDRLANEGVRFTRAYVTSPICTPSRYSLLRGRHAGHSPALLSPVAKGMVPFPPTTPARIGWDTDLLPGEPTIASVLQGHGYATGMVGKWHLGIDEDVVEEVLPLPRDPDQLAESEIDDRLSSAQRLMSAYIATNFGFDYVASLYARNLSAMVRTWAFPRTVAVHNVDWITQGAIEFIQREHRRPFFLYVATTVPHAPRTGPTETDPRMTPAGRLTAAPAVQPSRESVLERVAAAGLGPRTASLTWLDDGIGALLDQLEQVGVDDRTVVFLMSDHGNRGKYTLYEKGARVPCFVRWPGHVEPGTSRHEIVANIDIAPTIFEMAGIEPPDDVLLDGRSWVPLLRGESSRWRDHLLLEVAYARGIVTRDWKFIALRFPPEIDASVDREGANQIGWDGTRRVRFGGPRLFPGYFDRDQLYDLRADPDEQLNLAGDPAWIAELERLRALLRSSLAAHPHAFGEFR